MNQKKFLKRLAEEYAKNVAISTAKNADYADAEDAFLNFRACEAFGIDPKVGLIVRILDKVMRVNNLVKPGRIRKVKDEKIGDTLSDGANYMMILKLFIEDEDERVINKLSFRGPGTEAYNDNKSLHYGTRSSKGTRAKTVTHKGKRKISAVHLAARGDVDVPVLARLKSRRTLSNKTR